MFELSDRDAAARLCKWKISDYEIKTPNIAIVVNPNRQAIAPAEMKKEFGVEIIITNSYIILKNEEITKKVISEGLHKFLNFSGPIYTDSGTFQMFSQNIEIENAEEIVEFQKKFGSDIITPVDIFTLPKDDYKIANKKLKQTLERIAAAKKILATHNSGDALHLLNGPIQGGSHLKLRAAAAKQVAKLEPDVFSIGGIVPLMEQYRFRELADIIITCKQNLPANKPVHAFGAGHPITFAFLAAVGCDLFDSAMYSLAAQRGAYLTLSGTQNLSELSEFPCACKVCANSNPFEIKKMEKEKQEEFLTRHNLYTTMAEMRTVREAIRGQWLWELVQQRARAHPNLLRALAHVWENYPKYFSVRELVSKKSALLWLGEESNFRPEILRAKEFLKNVRAKKFFRKEPFGKIPVGLKWAYPFSQSIVPSQRFEKAKAKPEEVFRQTVQYQFGKSADKKFKKVFVEVSKNTGRPVRAWDSKKVLLGTFRPHDGFFIPTKFSAEKIPMKKVFVKDKEVAEHAKAGRSVFAKFVSRADKNIFPGEEVAVYFRKKFLNCGTAVLNSQEMKDFKRGVAVAVR
ncbi:MAG TPA: tRNA guanosine(15) transglycosylase TgtA [archaeon]|nr:tRNA guanosine(15) transglycosylase TgtA [archaeon]